MPVPPGTSTTGGKPLRSVLRRRPSASLLISCAALFLSLGGVGYAATTIGANSVGSAQLKNGAVTYKKIAPNSVGQVRLATGGVTNAKLAKNSVSYKDIQAGAVGTVRANLNQLQARLKTTCAAGTAVGSVDNKGNVICNSTLPGEYDTTASSAAITATATPISSLSLAAGPNYLGVLQPRDHRDLGRDGRARRAQLHADRRQQHPDAHCESQRRRHHGRHLLGDDPDAARRRRRCHGRRVHRDRADRLDVADGDRDRRDQRARHRPDHRDDDDHHHHDRSPGQHSLTDGTRVARESGFATPGDAPPRRRVPCPHSSCAVGSGA